MNEKLKRFFEIVSEVRAYYRAIGKIEFDMQCCAPPDGMDRAGEDMAILGKRVYELTHSDEYVFLLTALHENGDGLTPVQKKSIDYFWEDREKEKNFTPEFQYEADLINGKAYGKWLEAKSKSDYSLFSDSFAKVIDITRRAIDLRDSKKATYYDTCLDDFEKGGSTAQLDAFFAQLKARILPLLSKIVKDGKPIRNDFMKRPCSLDRQEAMSRYLLDVEGLKRSSLGFMTTEHPFTTNFGACDVRVTSHFYEDNFISNVFSTLHEGGHALFMQNEPEEFDRNHVCNRMSAAMHECVSRFYENIIGRSEAFIRFITPKIKEIAGGTFDDVSEREMFEAANEVTPSLIRTDADELTYCIHIMIRYELEKEFVNGNITVDEVPALWNKKYKEYLGIDVPDDARGCLQDVHWSGVGYGYFPSYALGNAYGAQILDTMEKDFDVFGAAERGELSRIKDWLTDRVFSIASLCTPDEWIRKITGKPLDAGYYLNYLEKKFSAIYKV